MNAHAPVLTRTVRFSSFTPWLNEDIIKARERRRHAECNWRKSGLSVHVDLLREARVKVKVLCHHVNVLCHQAKRAYCQQQIDACDYDQKTLFKLTNRLLSKQSDTSLPACTSHEALAEEFAQHFKT